MHMTRNDSLVANSSSDLLSMLAKATKEGKAAAADLCSTRLDKLATHAANEGLSAAEIVELLREEAAADPVPAPGRGGERRTPDTGCADE